MKENAKTKVVVSLSGGVDSAVAACLLIKQGYDVEGVFMKNWSGDEFGLESDCPWEEDQRDAQSVCETLGIPFRSVNFEKEYREKVVNYFFEEYGKGRTPNPDVMCNKEIKFNIFLDKAKELGAEYIATGHYARISRENGMSILLKGKDSNKDQSYFLHRLTQEQLGKSMFPVGEMEKSEVRSLAKKHNLPIADKKDSQGICFIGKIDVQKFLRSRITKRQGKIVDADTGHTLGEHEGVMFYTVGQREGIGIGGAKEPYFVVDKDIEKNILYVAQGKDNPKLFSNEVKFEDLHLISDETPEGQLTASIRYRHTPQKGILDLENNKFVFEEPQRAPTSGQSIVFYNEDICLGGGTIL